MGGRGHDPEEKLRFDIEYIRNPSFCYGLKIVIRQLWLVLADATTTILGHGGFRD